MRKSYKSMHYKKKISSVVKLLFGLGIQAHLGFQEKHLAESVKNPANGRELTIVFKFAELHFLW